MEHFMPLIVTSPSGGGKTTLVQHLLMRHPEFARSVSVTTRDPRGDEEAGRDYHFVTREAFDEMEARGDFAEWAEVHGQCYGTSLERIAQARASGLHGMIFVIDVQGARQLKARVPEAVSVLILPPSITELERRLRGRDTDSQESVARRLRDARVELSHYAMFDYVVVNDDLTTACTELEAVVTAERARRWRRASLVERVLTGESIKLP